MRASRSRLRRGLTDRGLLALKCAAAAGAAWLLAGALTGAEQPYYAPMTAFLMIQPTVAASLRDSGQYLLAAALGAGVALGLHAVLPAGALALAATVCVAVLLGGLPVLGSERVTVSFWALFVLVVGGAEPLAYVAQRLPEAAIGVLVGLAVNLAVPPLLVAPADQQLRRLREDLAAVLRQMADDVRDEWPPERPAWGRAVVEGLVAEARAAVAWADESLRWNPRGRALRARGRAQQDALERLEHAALTVRALSRLLLDAAADEDPEADADHRAGLSDDVRPLVAEALADAAERVRGADDHVPTALRRLRADVAALQHSDPALWLTEGALVLQLERLDRETRDVATGPGPGG